MAKRYDITGQRFGKLLVLGRAESRGPGRTMWECLCDCGNRKDIRGDALKDECTKSCGECSRSKKSIDELFTWELLPASEVCQRASEAGLNFGQYIAKEYRKRLAEDI